MTRCLVCPSTDLFVRKDFPQRLGVLIVAVGIIGSSIAWHYAHLAWTFGILFATALADLVLFALVGNALMCYRCGAQYRGVEEMDAHGQFNLETHEKYRQLAARLKRRARPGRLEVSAGSPRASHSVTPAVRPSPLRHGRRTASHRRRPARADRRRRPLRRSVRADVRQRREHLRDAAAGRGAAAHARRRGGHRCATRRSGALPCMRAAPGSGLAGDSLGRGLVDRLLAALPPHPVAIGDDAVTVQPGVVLAQLNERLRKDGRQFGPDPADEQVTTMGSVDRARRLGQPLAGLRLGAAACARAGGRAGRRADRAAVAACAAGRRRSRARRTRRRYLAAGVREIVAAPSRGDRRAAARGASSTAAATICTTSRTDDGDRPGAAARRAAKARWRWSPRRRSATVPLPQHTGVRAAVLRVAGQRGRGGGRAVDASAAGVRPDGPPAPEPGPRDGPAVRVPDSRRRRGRAAGRARGRLGRGGARRDPARSKTWSFTGCKLASGSHVALDADDQRADVAARAAVRAHAVPAARARRGRCRMSRTSPCRRRSCRRFCSGRSKRCGRGRSRRRSSATRRTGSCTSGRSSTWPSERRRAEPARPGRGAVRGARGRSAARSAASMPRGTAARRSSSGSTGR